MQSYRATCDLFYTKLGNKIKICKLKKTDLKSCSSSSARFILTVSTNPSELTASSANLSAAVVSVSTISVISASG